MSILCAIFGHKSHEHTFSGAEYMHIKVGPIDGIGRVHATLYAICPRCGQRHRAGAIHLPKQKGGAA